MTQPQNGMDLAPMHMPGGAPGGPGGPGAGPGGGPGVNPYAHIITKPEFPAFYHTPCSLGGQPDQPLMVC